MPRKQYSPAYRHAEMILSNYWTNKKALEERVRDYALDHQRNTWERGIRSDPTASNGIRLAEDQYMSQLRNYIRAVEETLFEFAGRGNGAAVVMLIKLIYWDKTHDMRKAAEAIHYSYTNVQRACEGFIKELMRHLGWISGD